jgi:hypothetical protein
MEEAAKSFIAECFWPGVTDAQVAALELRARASAGKLQEAGDPVRYLGSILMRDDEVVLCQFEGTPDAVRRAAELAEVPFERILETSLSPWPPSRNGGTT